jgi:adenylyltransferase/sulfurtransferase
MIISPEKLQQWLNKGKSFTALDIRPKEMRKEFPLSKLNPVIADIKSIPSINNNLVLICQFGIVTEGIIYEKELKNTYSLLGGAQAWNEFQLSKEDFSRWSRQTVLSEIGLEGQKKLMKANIVIVGMGGLGCPAAQSLMAAGVGHLKIVDGDKVELSNLHRQPLYGAEDVGRMKVEVAKEKLERLNRDAVVEVADLYLNEDNGFNIINETDIVIDATDNIPTRILIDRFSKELGIPMVYGGLFRYEGQIGVFNINGSKGYTDLFPISRSDKDNCANSGVLGMLPGIIGNIQALETIKLIVGIKQNLAGKLLMYDGMNHSTQTIIL